MGGGSDIGEGKRRLSRIEKILERKDREERRKNIVIKGLRLEGKELKEGVEEIFKKIGKGRSRSSEKGRERREERGGNSTSEAEEYGAQEGSYEEEKSVQIKRNSRRRERKRKENVDRLRETAGEEREKGKKTWDKYGKIQIEDIWWKWDKAREMLVSGRGEEWRHRRQEEKVERNEQGE